MTNSMQTQFGQAKAMAFAVGIILLVLGLYYYWFAVADRYGIFLYGHLGAMPFDEVTSSRYWMAGLVATGMVMLVALVVHGVARLLRPYAFPDWRQVWLFSVMPIAVGILLITMLANAPTLPLSLAVASVVAACAGLALALVVVQMFVLYRREFLWLAWISLGIVPALVLTRAIELPARGIIDMQVAVIVTTATIVFGLLWTTLWLRFYQWRQKRFFAWWQLYLSGCAWAYLFLPTLHYWLFAPAAYRYISTSTNFFALSLWVQLLSFAIVWGILKAVEVASKWRVRQPITRAI